MCLVNDPKSNAACYSSVADCISDPTNSCTSSGTSCVNGANTACAGSYFSLSTPAFPGSFGPFIYYCPAGSPPAPPSKSASAVGVAIAVIVIVLVKVLAIILCSCYFCPCCPWHKRRMAARQLVGLPFSAGAPYLLQGGQIPMTMVGVPVSSTAARGAPAAAAPPAGPLPSHFYPSVAAPPVAAVRSNVSNQPQQTATASVQPAAAPHSSKAGSSQPLTIQQARVPPPLYWARVGRLRLPHVTKNRLMPALRGRSSLR